MSRRRWVGALNVAAFVLALLVLIGLPVWLTAYKFNDCRAVGHGALYCVLMMGK